MNDPGVERAEFSKVQAVVLHAIDVRPVDNSAVVSNDMASRFTLRQGVSSTCVEISALSFCRPDTDGLGQRYSAFGIACDFA